MSEQEYKYVYQYAALLNSGTRYVDGLYKTNNKMIDYADYDEFKETCGLKSGVVVNLTILHEVSGV